MLVSEFGWPVSRLLCFCPCQVADLGFAVAVSWQIPAAVMWLYPLFSRAVFRPSVSQKSTLCVLPYIYKSRQPCS